MVACLEKTGNSWIIHERKKRTGQQPSTRKSPGEKTFTKLINCLEVGSIMDFHKRKAILKILYTKSGRLFSTALWGGEASVLEMQELHPSANIS